MEGRGSGECDVYSAQTQARGGERSEIASDRPASPAVNVDRHISFARVSAASYQKHLFSCHVVTKQSVHSIFPFFPAVFHSSDSAFFPPVHVVR